MFLPLNKQKHGLTVGTAVDVHSFQLGAVGKGMSLSGTNTSSVSLSWVPKPELMKFTHCPNQLFPVISNLLTLKGKKETAKKNSSDMSAFFLNISKQQGKNINYACVSSGNIMAVAFSGSESGDCELQHALKLCLECTCKLIFESDCNIQGSFKQLLESEISLTFI